MKIPPSLLIDYLRHDTISENVMDSGGSAFLDNLFAIKFATLLSKPYTQWDAFKSGVIDERGNILVQRGQRNRDQRKSFNQFHRLVWNIKRLVSRAAPGRIASTVAAAKLLMESCPSNDDFIAALDVLETHVFSEEDVTQDELNLYFENRRKMLEDAPVTNTTGIANPDILLFKKPLNRKRKAKIKQLG